MVIMAKIYNRDSKKLVEEKEYKEGILVFLYQTVIGRILLKLVIARPWFSNLRAKYQRSSKSKKDILPFVKEYHVDMSDYNMDSFESLMIFLSEKELIKRQLSK